MKTYRINHTPPSLWRDPWQFIAFGFGSGAMPIMPGTFGTLMALPFCLMLSALPVLWYGLITASLFIAAIFLSDHCSSQLGEHDHPGMVIDELATFPLVLIGLPVNWLWWGAAFILFRFFDIVKPWPIGYIDRQVKGGFGMMLDDLLAGFYTWLILIAIYTVIR